MATTERRSPQVFPTSEAELNAVLTADSLASADQEVGPALEAYQDLARAHAQPLYELAVLLLEQPDIAWGVAQDALRRTWDSIAKDDLFVEPEEMLYRAVVRDSARRLSRPGARGYQPPTTSDGRHINAIGVVDRFVPDQRAAVFLAVRMGTGYRFAATVTGLNEGRVRDLCFAARQEYGEAQRHGKGSAAVSEINSRSMDWVRPSNPPPACPSQLPLISARLDGQLATQEAAALDAHLAGCEGCTAALARYGDFGVALKEIRLPLPERDPVDLALEIPTVRQQATGGRRLLQLAKGPAFMVVLLVAGLYVFRWFTPVPVETGAGRTPDLIYARARDGNETLVLESGSGRELGRFPAGTLDPQGWHVYSATNTCGATDCQTALQVTETATNETQAVGTLPGRLAIVAADPSRQRMYLSDAAAGSNQLIAFDLLRRKSAGSVRAPAEVEEAFLPQRSALAAKAPVLFTLGRDSGGDLTLVRTDLETLTATSIQSVAGPPETGLSLWAAPDGTRAYVYFPSGPAIQRVNASGGGHSAELSGPGIRAGEGFVPSGGELVAMSPDGSRLYCLIPSGGIAVLQSESLALLNVLAPDQRFRSIGASSDGRQLYGLGFDGTYRVIDPTTGEIVFSRTGVRAADLLQVDMGE